MKNVLITGANKGIGFETAKQLAQPDYYVYLGSRDKEKGEKAVEKLFASGIKNVECIQLDVTDAISIQSATEELERKIVALDVLINNAGIAGPQPQNISCISISDLQQVFATNFFGAVQVTQHLLPLLKKSQQPIIINVSSELGSLSTHSNSQNPNYKIYDAYSCSKAALNAFTVMLANELRETNFKINSVTPGYSATDLNEFKGSQTAEEGAVAIVKYATLNDSGPTGKYFKMNGEIKW